MQNEQYTGQGKTYVFWQDSNNNGQFSPVIVGGAGKRRRRGRNSRSYRDKGAISWRWVKLFGHWFQIPTGILRLTAVLWDRVKLMFITLIAGHIFLSALPAALRFLLDK